MSDWVDVVLGDVRMGDYVRVKPGAVLNPRFSDTEGKVIGFRNGVVYVTHAGGDTVGFQPYQLERASR